MKPTRTWVLIADGARARVLVNDGPGRGLAEVDGLEFSADHSATHDLVSDREGRSYSSHGQGRSAIDSRSDPTGISRQSSRTNWRTRWLAGSTKTPTTGSSLLLRLSR